MITWESCVNLMIALVFLKMSKAFLLTFFISDSHTSTAGVEEG